MRGVVTVVEPEYLGLIRFLGEAHMPEAPKYARETWARFILESKGVTTWQEFLDAVNERGDRPRLRR